MLYQKGLVFSLLGGMGYLKGPVLHLSGGGGYLKGGNASGNCGNKKPRKMVSGVLRIKLL
jgi:hypothetical protein